MLVSEFNIKAPANSSFSNGVTPRGACGSVFISLCRTTSTSTSCPARSLLLTKPAVPKFTISVALFVKTSLLACMQALTNPTPV